MDPDTAKGRKDESKEPPRFDTKALVKLNSWRDELDLNQARLADLLGGGKARDVHPSLVSRWCTGHSRPEPMYQVLLERLAGIACAEWLTKDERKRVAGCAREANKKLRKIGYQRIEARKRGRS